MKRENEEGICIVCFPYKSRSDSTHFVHSLTISLDWLPPIPATRLGNEDLASFLLSRDDPHERRSFRSEIVPSLIIYRNGTMVDNPAERGNEKEP